MNHIQLIEDNILTYYKAIARLLNGDFTKTDEVAWFTTGRRSLYRFNGVVSTKIRAGDLSKVIEPVLQTFLSKDLPFFWADWSDAGTPGLGDYLGSRNVHFDRFTGMPCMSRGLDNLPELPLLKEADIVRVESQQDQADWLNVLMEGFDEPESSREDFQQIIANSLTEPNPVFEHFLARWQGEPCSISTLLKASHGAGIYHVTTLPRYRGKKLGKALTLAAIQSARRTGYKEAVLFATPSGFTIYQQLEFQTVSTVDAFIWSGHE